MGQAKTRGTFEERKTRAIERDKKLCEAYAEVQRRRPSPKHTILMATLFGLAAGFGNDYGKYRK